MRSRHESVVAPLLLAFAYAFSASARQATEYGPAKGTLVIVGGGALEKSGIIEKFIELAGGPDRNFIIVPTAAGNKTEDGNGFGFPLRQMDDQTGVGRRGPLDEGVQVVKALSRYSSGDESARVQIFSG